MTTHLALRRAGSRRMGPAPVHESLTAGLVLLVVGIAAVLVTVWALQERGPVRSPKAPAVAVMHHVHLEVIASSSVRPTGSPVASVGGAVASAQASSPPAPPPLVTWRIGPNSGATAEVQIPWNERMTASSGTASVTAIGQSAPHGKLQHVECLILVDNKLVSQQRGTTVTCSAILP
jgi:hypothetical protein